MGELKIKGRKAGPYLVVLALAAFLYHQAIGIEPAPDGQLGAAFWPKTILLLAIATCVGAIARSLVPIRPARRADPATISSTPGTEPGVGETPAAVHADVHRAYPWIAIALTTGYIVLFPRIGYFLATLLYVIAFVYCGNFRKLWIAALVGVAASLAFMAVFMKLVYVSLPVGRGPFAGISTFVMAALGIR